jgi:hypothetical protein
MTKFLSYSLSGFSSREEATKRLDEELDWCQKMGQVSDAYVEKNQYDSWRIEYFLKRRN